MPAANPLAALRQALADIYPTVDDARLVLDDAGIATRRIRFDPAAEINWHAILEEVQRQGQLQALLDVVAAGDYGKNPAFAAACQAALAAPVAPPALEGDDGFSLRVPVPPAAPAELCGREDLLHDLAVALPAAPRLLALGGLPGAGKTVLARALANRPEIAAAFPDGRAWIALGPNPQVAVELGRLMDQVGLPAAQFTGEQDRIGALRRGLDGRRYLLVLDDAWEPAHVQPFLDACPPPACILLTTRNRQLADDLDAVSFETPLVAAQDGCEILALAGAEARAAVEVDPEAALALVESLGCLPLALHVAGRRLNRLARSGAEGPEGAVAALRCELETTIRLLGLTAPGGATGQTGAEWSLEAILAASYDALPGDDRRQAFRRLAIFGPQPHTFSAAAMAAVWEVGEDEASDLRNDLVEVGLVQRVRLMAEDDEKPRYAFVVQPVIAALAAKRLDLDPAEARRTGLLHAQYYAAVVATAREEMRSGALAAGLARLDRDVDQLRRAVGWVLEQSPSPETDRCLRDLVVPLRNYALAARGLYREVMGWLDPARAACQRLADPVGEAGVLRMQGDGAVFLQRPDEAAACYREALARYQAAGDPLGASAVHKALGDLALRAGDADAARRGYQAALDACQAGGASTEAANARLALGNLALRQDDLATAGEQASAALAGYEAAGNRLGAANAHLTLGDLALRRDDLAEAEAQGQAALAGFHDLDVRQGAANAHLALGGVALRRNDLAEATVRYQEALLDYQAVDDLLGAANTRKAFGDLALRQDDPDSAGRHYQAALDGYRTIDNHLGVANAEKALGDLALRMNDPQLAKARYQAALAGFQTLQNRLGQANTLAGQGQVALVEGDEAKAGGLLEQAKAIFLEIKVHYGVAAQTGNFGWALLRAGRTQQAIPYLQQAAMLFEQMGRKDDAARHRQAAEEAAAQDPRPAGTDAA